MREWLLFIYTQTFLKDPLIKVKPKIEEGVILGWLKKEYNNSSHRH